MNAFKRAVELKPDDTGLQKALKKSTARLKGLEAATVAGQRDGGSRASSHAHAVLDLSTHTSSSSSSNNTGSSTTTSNQKVRQEVSKKAAPLRGLYSDKEVTRMYEWGPLPENGEYNQGYLASGACKQGARFFLCNIHTQPTYMPPYRFGAGCQSIIVAGCVHDLSSGWVGGYVGWWSYLQLSNNSCEFFKAEVQRQTPA